MKKSLKYLLVSALTANALALSWPGFQGQATVSLESASSQESGHEETSEEWQNHDCAKLDRKDVLNQVRKSRDLLTSVALK